MVTTLISFVVVAALSFIGIYAIAVFIVKRQKQATYEYATWYVRECVMDVLYHRYSFWLHLTDFPSELRSDLDSLLGEEERNRWDKILKMNSKQTQGWWVQDLAYFWFVMPYQDELAETYKTMIAPLAAKSLSISRCTITDVIVDFNNWVIPGYRMCCIRYARTAREQEVFRKIQTEREEAISDDSKQVRDPELDSTLENIGG